MSTQLVHNLIAPNVDLVVFDCQQHINFFISKKFYELITIQNLKRMNHHYLTMASSLDHVKHLCSVVNTAGHLEQLTLKCFHIRQTRRKTNGLKLWGLACNSINE